jgi:lysophospholipase L1-like esterase
MRIAFVGDSLTKGRPGGSYVAVLRERLPGHTLINLGEGNDTAVSLYRRLSRLHWGEPFDIAFLWVGVNDVKGGSSWTFRVASALARKPRSKSLHEFRSYYQATLDLLRCHARRVIGVSPLLKGEDIHNPWNRELEVLSRAIEEMASQRDRVEYLDVRTAFVQKLIGRRMSDYLPRSVVQVALDTLTLKDNERINRKADERGLHFTLDGIHLNGLGAEIVAEMFLTALS